jgi:hypothetical protein
MELKIIIRRQLTWPFEWRYDERIFRHIKDIQLSGKYITQHQKIIYMSNRNQGLSQTLSAAKAGISTRSARRIEHSLRPAPIKRKGRTRLDLLIEVWASVLLPLLRQEPTLTGLTLWEYLDDNYPGQYPRICLLKHEIPNIKVQQHPFASYDEFIHAHANC